MSSNYAKIALLVTASGTVSYQPAYSLLEQALDTAKREHVSLILVDTLVVKGTLTTEDRYDLGLALAAYVALGARVKMAFVGKPTAGTGVMIAQNGGAIIEMFSTREDAMNWLDTRR